MTKRPRKPGTGGKRAGAGRPRKSWLATPSDQPCRLWRAALAHAGYVDAA
jgi:hypothetical protein